jgi:hypothetical protein
MTEDDYVHALTKKEIRISKAGGVARSAKKGDGTRLMSKCRS